MAEPHRPRLILHPDYVAQLKKIIDTFDRLGSHRNLTRDEVLSLTAFRRKYNEHFEGVALLASKPLSEQQDYNALLRARWQSPESIETRKAFIQSTAAITKPTPTTTQSHVMDINNIIDR